MMSSKVTSTTLSEETMHDCSTCEGCSLLQCIPSTAPTSPLKELAERERECLVDNVAMFEVRSVPMEGDANLEDFGVLSDRDLDEIRNR